MKVPSMNFLIFYVRAIINHVCNMHSLLPLVCLQFLFWQRRRIVLVKKDLSSVKNELIFRLRRTDFHACKLFLVGNDRSISKHQNIQDKRFFKPSNSVVRDVSHDPEQLIHNFSSHILSEARKSVLCKGLHFTLNLWNMQIIPFLLNSFTKTFKLPI